MAKVGMASPSEAGLSTGQTIHYNVGEVVETSFWKEMLYVIQDSGICRYSYSGEIKKVPVDRMHFPCLILLFTFFLFSVTSHHLHLFSFLIL